MTRPTAIVIASLAAIVCATTAYAQTTAVPPTTLTGTVLRDGKPAVDAEVYLQTGGFTGTQASVVRTNKDGRFSFDRPKSGVRLYALAPGSACTNAEWWPGQADPKLALYPGSKFTGLVVDGNGKPIEGAMVTLEQCIAFGAGRPPGTPYADLPPGLRTIATGKNGTFEFGHLPSLDIQEINVQLGIDKPGRAKITRGLEKKALMDVVKVVSPPECKINGTLYLPGKAGVAPEGTELSVVVTSPLGRQHRGAGVGKNGRFHFDKLPPGKATIMLSSPSSGQTHPWALPAGTIASLIPEQEAAVELTLAKGSVISGRVIERTTAKPIEGARLYVAHSGNEGSGSSGDQSVTDANGSFSLRVPPGDVWLSVDSIRGKDRSIYFIVDERPDMLLSVDDGKDLTDVVMAIDPRSREDDERIARKPVLPDFAVKPGTYSLTWDPNIPSYREVYSSGRYRGQSASSEMRVVPATVSAAPHFMALKFDSSGNEGLLLVVLDESKGTGKGWDRVYVDSNRNGDLTDDGGALLLGGRQSRKHTNWFGVKACQGPAGAEQAHNPYRVRLQFINDGPNVLAMLQRSGAWSCKIDSSAGPVLCAIADRDFSGTFSDYCKDMVFIDSNGVGRLIGEDSGPQAVRLDRLSRIGSAYVSIKPNAIGNHITVEPYTGPMGQLAVSGRDIQGMNAAASRLIISSSKVSYTFDNCSGKALDLPVDSYWISSCELLIDKTLPVSCSSRSQFKVEEGKQTELLITGPLKMAISKSEKALVYKAGATETISWDITIGDKTIVDSFGDRAIEPQVKFFDSKGRQVGATRASYT